MRMLDETTRLTWAGRSGARVALKTQLPPTIYLWLKWSKIMSEQSIEVVRRRWMAGGCMNNGDKSLEKG
jgi:hypothetical protein